MNRTNNRRIGVCIVAFTLLLLGAAFAEVPKLINYQGYLTDRGGTPVTDTVPMVFSLYDAESGGALLWTETWGSVSVNEGVFNVLLGGVETLDLDFNADYWLETSVNGELLDARHRLVSVGYAFRAEYANSAAETDPEFTAWDKTTGISITESQISDLSHTDSQTLSFASPDLSISGGNSVDLSGFLDNTDSQTLSFASPDLSISGGNSVDLSGFLDNTDSQDLSLSGNTLSLTGDGTSVDLSGYLDNTDEQTLSLSGDTLSISGSGSSVDLSISTVVELDSRVSDLESVRLMVRPVFVTSTTHDGNLGGLTGADAICQGLADAAGLSGTYMAWLSDDTNSPSTRFSRLGIPFKRVDGELIATDWDDLTNRKTLGYDDFFLFNSIDVTESGGAASGDVWTSTLDDGTDYNLADYHCVDWSSSDSAVQGLDGLMSRTNADWTAIGLSSCNSARHLYCFSQTAELDVFGSNAITNLELNLSGNTLYQVSNNGIESVDLSGFLDDSQTLSLSGNTLTISGSGSSVDLSTSTEFSNIQSQLDDIEAAATALTNTVATLQSNHDGLQADHDALQADHDTLQADHDALQADHDALQADHDALQADHDALQEEFYKTAFVTAAGYDGAMGGLAGADAICQAEADSAGLDGAYWAWLSDSSESPSSRFTAYNGPLVLVDGTRIADGWNDLTDGTLLNHLNQTASGGGNSTSVWTGTLADGGPNTTSDKCSDWTSNDSSIRSSGGFTTVTDSTWTAAGGGACNQLKSLYCFEQ